MDVEARVEGVQHVLVLGQRGDDAELNLRVVRRQQQVVVVAGHEGAAYLAAPFGADGDVLQVGVGGGEAARGSDSLVVDSMQSARGGVDELGEAIEIGAHQLADGAVLQYQRDDGVLIRELGEDVFGGGVLLGGGARRLVGHLQLLVEYVAQLLRRADVEAFAGQPVDFLLDGVALLGELPRIFPQRLNVDTNAFLLHIHQHIHQRKLYLLIEMLELGVAQLRRHEGVELPHSRHLCGLALEFIAQHGGADEVERVAHLGVDEVMRQLHIEDFAPQGDFEFSKDIFEVLEVVAELGGGRAL